MNTAGTLKTLLEQSFIDRHVDKEEKIGFYEVFSGLSDEQRAFVRNRAFDLVREAQQEEDMGTLLKWLQAVVKSLDSSRPTPPENSGFFSPGSACLETILATIRNTRNTMEICVFTISDNRITDAIIKAMRRGIEVRIITDNDKTRDRGSDIFELIQEGVPVRLDSSEQHMHHKFAIFDKQTLITGSFNWTRSASLYNYENILLIDDQQTLGDFQNEFESLWVEFA